MAVGLAAAWALAPAAKGTALGAVVGSSAPDDQPASFLPHSPGGYGLTLLMAAAALASVAALRRRGVLSGHAFATARRRVENLSALGWFAAGVAIYAALVLGQGLGSALAPGADHPTNLSSMAGIFGSGYAAVLVTAAAFTLVHVGAVDASGLAALFALAVGFGVAFERTGRLGVPAVMHAAFNLFNVAVVTLPG